MLKYHQFRGRLGMGDLHPGGAPATAEILRLLEERGVRRVLEIGAGIGNTALRMAALGWDVTALEPDPVLFRTLAARLGARAHADSLLAYMPREPYDAVVAESVFCMLEVPQSLAHVRRLLAPGGLLAFVEAVWADHITPSQSRDWHDRTLRLFGIPVGSRERITWRDWLGSLRAGGFETLCARRLPRGSAGHPPTADRRATMAGLIRDPRLALWMARYRWRKRLVRVPGTALESWVFLGRALEEAG